MAHGWASGWRAGDAALSAQRRVSDGVRPRVTSSLKMCVDRILAAPVRLSECLRQECLVVCVCVCVSAPKKPAKPTRKRDGPPLEPASGRTNRERLALVGRGTQASDRWRRPPGLGDRRAKLSCVSFVSMKRDSRGRERRGLTTHALQRTAAPSTCSHGTLVLVEAAEHI